MKKCGLLGEKLSHSYSPQIHTYLGNYPYLLYEKEREEVEGFVLRGDFDAINVTIPYKKTVVPFCTRLSPVARRLGSVNTLVREEDGSIFGHNTDYFGFSYMLDKSGVSPEGKKVLVLGSGGAAVTVVAVLRDRGAREVIVISRSGENNYENISRHADAEMIVNTTPVGMYPHPGASPVRLSDFPACRAALDLIYNPEKTAFLLEAEALGIPSVNGLTMLVAQAKESAEYFGDAPLSDSIIDKTVSSLQAKQRNLVLVGMPGSGKSTLGKILAAKTGRRFVDADAEIEKAAGMSIPDIFAQEGEDGFRKRETAVLEKWGMEAGLVLATGGGCVTREENTPILRQNGAIFWIKRDIEALPREGRPLSKGADLAAMYAKRRPLYEKIADITVENRGEAEAVAERMLVKYEDSCH